MKRRNNFILVCRDVQVKGRETETIKKMKYRVKKVKPLLIKKNSFLKMKKEKGSCIQ